MTYRELIETYLPSPVKERAYRAKQLCVHPSYTKITLDFDFGGYYGVDFFGWRKSQEGHLYWNEIDKLIQSAMESGVGAVDYAQADRYLPKGYKDVQIDTDKATAPIDPHEEAINPKHYKDIGIEPLEVIRRYKHNWDNTLEPASFANIIKYIMRSPFKGNKIQDLKKARVYLTEWIDYLESSSKTVK